MGLVERSTRGRLLVATPDLADPNFARTVVLMLEHTEEAALGLVLNRPRELRVADALPAWGDVCSAPACLFVGGPVQPDAVIGLARTVGAAIAVEPLAGTQGEGFQPLFASMGTLDLDRDPLAFDGLDGVRVFVGYAGWGPGQLDRELHAGGWLVVDAMDDDAFTSNPAELWREVLARQPGRVRLFANAPEDPSTN
ncbi:MAG: YqgE/AlgH family protein [Actinobacteria bacterium]|nr:YqgE/AlgH family protein [Actinomycetota bacterium]